MHQGALMQFQPVPNDQEPAEILVRGTPLRPFSTDKSVAYMRNNSKGFDNIKANKKRKEANRKSSICTEKVSVCYCPFKNIMLHLK